MKHIDLLGTSLRSEFLCDLFETHDVQVEFVYDRSGEGEPDEYRAALPELGLEFLFDEDQALRTLFVQPVEITTDCPLRDLSESAPCFESIAEARRYAERTGVRSRTGAAESLGKAREWIRFEADGHVVHYEFHGPRLGLITFTVAT